MYDDFGNERPVVLGPYTWWMSAIFIVIIFTIAGLAVAWVLKNLQPTDPRFPLKLWGVMLGTSVVGSIIVNLVDVLLFNRLRRRRA